MTLKNLITFLILATASVEGAKILGVFPRASKSHQILGSSLLKELAKRGHEVTMVSPYPLAAPVKNYEDIELTGLENFNEENDIMKKFFQRQNSSHFEKISTIMTNLHLFNEQFLSHPVFREFLASNRSYDLVIQYWLGTDAFLGIADHFGAPVIAFSTVGATFLTNLLTMNPAPYSYVSSFVPLFPDEMNFLQRCVNTISCIFMDSLFYFYISLQQEKLLKTYFPKAPSTKELRSNVSLVFLNSHFSIESPRPYVPTMIQIGGLHVQEPKELKGDLKTFMDNAVEGVVYFSLGSNVRISDLPKDKYEAIIATFSRLPLKVLWKTELQDIKDLPSNVHTAKWLPQTDILAHKNTKLFITHGGLLSTIETVHHGVPIVGIPLFGDQDTNVRDAVNKGYAVKMPFRDLTTEKLTQAINEALNNPKYRKNVKRRSRILKDQPLKPLDNAVFWVEYVLRHKGAHHLKTSALKLELYQYYLLDVVAVLLGILFTVIVGCCLVLCVILKTFKRIFVKKISHTKKNE